MIKEYYASVRGKSHEFLGKGCEDAYRIVSLANGYKVMAVADGVGSCLHGGKGAQIAVRTVTDFIRDNFPIDNSAISIKSMLRTAYNKALIEIQGEAIRNCHSISDYDTTLMAVIYGENKPTFIANCGDGAVCALKMDGSFVELSVRQNSDGFVIPLRAGYEFWKIDEINEPLASVLVATDGMMDQFRNVNVAQGFYIPLMMLFADPYVIQYLKRKGVDVSSVVKRGNSGYNKTLINALRYVLHKNYRFAKPAVRKITGEIMRNGTPFELLRRIQDDKTFVCLYSTSARPRAKSIEYYTEPDWKQISAELQKRLYGSMHCDPKSQSTADCNRLSTALMTAYKNT